MVSETPTANILGTIGTVCWCIQLIPQIIHNYRRKDCTGLQPIMLFLWAASGVPFSIYFLSRRASIPIEIQPQLFTFFCIVAWAQSLYYPPKQKSRKTQITLVASFVVVALALEAGFIIPCRNAYDRGTSWPSLIFGIIASVLLAIGLVPPYFELAKRQGQVVGINFVFLTLDFSGAFFSALSLAFAREFDLMGIVLYCIVGAMELGIFISHFIWWLRIGRHNKKGDEESQDGTDLDIASTRSTAELEVERTHVDDTKKEEAQAKLSAEKTNELSTADTICATKTTV